MEQVTVEYGHSLTLGLIVLSDEVLVIWDNIGIKLELSAVSLRLYTGQFRTEFT